MASHTVRYNHYDNTRLDADENRMLHSWALDGNSREFAAGFAYGLAVGKYSLAEAADDRIFISNDEDTYEALDPSDVVSIFGELFVVVDRDDHDTLLKDLQEIDQNGDYIFYLADDEESLTYAATQTVDFLQGLFTAATAFNIPFGDMLFSRPYKDGQFWDIVGLLQ